MKKPVVIVLLALLLCLAAGFYFYQNPYTQDGQLVLHGNVDIRQIALAFEGAGRIQALNVEEGDRVQRGEVLAVLDTQNLELQAEQAKAQVQMQSQALLRLQNGARPEEIAQAQSEVSAAQAQKDLATLALKRLKSMAKQGQGVSQQDLDRAESQQKVADAQLTQAQQALRLITLGARDEDIAIAKAQLQAAKAQLALLQYQIQQGTLKAPADAVVRSRLLEVGDMASAQRPVFALALMQNKWIRVYVDEPYLSQVTLGMVARVVSDGQNAAPVMGKVVFISSVAEFTPKFVQTETLRTSLVYEVRVRVEDKDNQLRLGQPVSVYLAVDQAQ